MHVSSGHIAELPRVKYEIGGTIRVGNYGLKAVFHGGFYLKTCEFSRLVLKNSLTLFY